MAEVGNLEQLLRSALAPVEPPEALTDRVERALSEITGAAADELAQWEMETMRDPRTWLPTAAAVVGGGAAAGALILVRARQRHRGRQARGFDAFEQSLRSVARDIEKRLGR